MFILFPPLVCRSAYGKDFLNTQVSIKTSNGITYPDLLLINWQSYSHKAIFQLMERVDSKKNLSHVAVSAEVRLILKLWKVNVIKDCFLLEKLLIFRQLREDLIFRLH